MSLKVARFQPKSMAWSDRNNHTQRMEHYNTKQAI